MNQSIIKFNLKVFKINSTHFELKGKVTGEIIEKIKENHFKQLKSKHPEIESFFCSITTDVDGEFKLWSYCYNQPKNQHYWKLFLPNELTESQNFQIVEFSFVLFIEYKQNIYCVIGGSGMSVIKKYIDPYFGIDLYQHFAKPSEDEIIEIDARSFASNISKKRQTYNLNQTISEALEYSEIPIKIKMIMRDELKNTIFKKYITNIKDKAILEVGAYFEIRKKINFDELKQLIGDIDKIKNDSSNYKELTLFSKIQEETLIGKLDEDLKERVVNDIIILDNPYSQQGFQQDIIEIVHPYHLEQFYECNKYLIKVKHSKGKTDLEVFDRTKLYWECTKFLYEKYYMVDRNKYDLKGKLFQINIVGCRDEKETTYGHFFSHITAEIEYLDVKYFRIDEQWYFISSDFIKMVNRDAQEYYRKYHLDENLLKKWENQENEDLYNLKHRDSNCFILDKVIKGNIELCDILSIHNNTAYFIHVKNGFDTKMRDLYIQVVLSAKKLSTDLKSTNGKEFLKTTLEYYNSRNCSNTIDIDAFLDQIVSGKIKISYVMAFNNFRFSGDGSITKIEKSQSNIAKYSLVQTVKEMQALNNFDIKVIDISEIL